ncbi:MAG: regulatory protein RecX [Lachnospiraceae bacterium]|nr:regulatory protein RecX [Lachnospiraceae bacterium]
MGGQESEIGKEVILLAKKKALSLLNYCDRTEYQLRKKLEEGEFPPQAIEEAIRYVYSYHYLDDRRYAENYILAKRDEKSVFEIREELKLRGVDSEIIEESLSNAEIDESHTVEIMFLKKFGHKDLSDPKLYEKALRYFAGKRFPYDAAKNGIRSAIGSIETDA